MLAAVVSLGLGLSAVLVPAAQGASLPANATVLRDIPIAANSITYLDGTWTATGDAKVRFA